MRTVRLSAPLFPAGWLILAFLSIAPVFAQTAAQTSGAGRPLIAQPVDESRLVRLRGNVHPLARAEFDMGTAPVDLPMQRMLLVLKRNPEQETALRKVLDDQQDRASPNFHKWLTPEQFGRQFGPTDADMETIAGWLQSHGFEVSATKGRTLLEFSGTAGQVREAFHTAVHKYVVGDQQHWANAGDPQIPAALAPAVAGVFTLHDFLKKPTLHYSPEAAPAQVNAGKRVQVTFPGGGKDFHALAPQDYATLYNINPVYDSGINGNGIFVGVVGRSNLSGTGRDVSTFMSAFGLCCSGNFGITLNGPDPGDLGGGEEVEATLDASWTKAVAPLASVQLVVSASTNTTDGVDLSELYIVEHNTFDVMTESFASCELFTTDAQLAGTSALAEQAAAQGITYFVSSGDNGAEGCDDPNSPPATHPVSVNMLASTAFNVAVGGTMFNEHGTDSTYWSDAAPIANSAISYIPENVWNESSATNGLWASSGGASAGNVQAGGTTAGWPKPAWQSGVAGIPSDGVRDLPDVSLTAAGHDPYLLCLEGSCVPDNQGTIYVYFVSGTSAAAPAFAGIMSLIDQQMLQSGQPQRQGQANYEFYRLAASQSGYPSQCNGSSTSGQVASDCIFNDVTTGNNVVPGEAGNQYQATAGYDRTTGLGSVNVANLVSQWGSIPFRATTTSLSLASATITHGTGVPFSIVVAPSSGSGMPTGDVSLVNAGGNAIGLGAFTLNGGSTSGSIASIPGGNWSFTAHYAGDVTFAPSNSAGSGILRVNPEPSTISETVQAFDPMTGNSVPLDAVPYGSSVYMRADVAGKSGYGVASGQVNFSDALGPILNSNVPLNSQGNTMLQDLAFDSGPHSISASYQGDVSFNPSSTTAPINFTVVPGFFLVPWTPSVINISGPGQSSWLNISEYVSSGLTSAVTFTGCSGLPAESKCTFAPSTTGAEVEILTVTTTAPHQAAEVRMAGGITVAWTLAGLGVVGILLTDRRVRCRGMLALILLALITIPACGGGTSRSAAAPTHQDPGTPAGTYKVTVTATAGSLTRTTSFVLVVK